MAKIRGIKPETWTDENFVELTPLARLLFIGLWNYACDNGHLEDRSKQIKLRLLPADDCNVADLLRELESAGRIARENGWITIPTLSDHQRIDRRWFSTCDKPGCDKPDPKKAEAANPERETRRGHSENTTSPPRASAGPRDDVDVDVDCDLSGTEGDGDRAALVARADSAQSLVAEWIDHCDDKPPGRVIGQVSRELKTMLDEGIDPTRVRTGLAEWNRRGLHPATLPSVVHELSTPQQRNGRQAETAGIFDRAAQRMGITGGKQ